MAFLPPILYMVWIRNIEKYEKEKWKPVFVCFIWGATLAVVAVMILEVLLSIPIVLTSSDYTTVTILTVVVVAPFAEELIKPIILSSKTVETELNELEDGFIYGAAAGLGFAATENLLYGATALFTEGFGYFILLISLRSVVGCLLHASATAWTGYGYGKYIMKKTKFGKVIPYFLLAVIIHAAYNFIPTFGEITGYSIVLIFALIFTIVSIIIVKNKIQKLDTKNIKV
jgi:RsiW-degrading membrane proteinase PrsW (M82 family)